MNKLFFHYDSELLWPCFTLNLWIWFLFLSTSLLSVLFLSKCVALLWKDTQDTAGGEVWCSLFIDWHGWWGPILHFGRRVGKHVEVAPTRVQGGDDMVVLHRYSMRGFTLSCPVKVCACPSEGAETGSWMTPASMPDVTAQLGRLMTEGPGPAHTCPSRAGQATSRGERGAAATFDGQMFWRGDSRDSCTTGTPPFLSTLR